MSDPTQLQAEAQRFRDDFQNLRAAVGGVIVGQQRVVEGVGNTAVSATANIVVQSSPIIGWAHGDSGAVGLPGDASLLSGTFTVRGSGDDIWYAADAFHYVYRPLTGNGTITARVVSLQNTDDWAKAGVMMRETLDPGSAYAFSLVTPVNDTALQWRGSAGAYADHLGGPVAAAP